MQKAAVMANNPKFSFANPVGKACTKVRADGSNPLPGRMRNDSMRNKAGASQASQNSYAGRSSSGGFSNASRAKEFK